MATINDLIARVRLELGDNVDPFRGTFRGTGGQTDYDLPAVRVQASNLVVFKTYPATMENLSLVQGTDYTLDSDNGIVSLTNPLEKDWMLTASGECYRLFSDAELTQYVSDAILMHTSGGDHETIRYRDSYGFIEYQTVAKTISNLPAIEEPLVAWLATIQCMWALLTDASIDIDIMTSEGTHLPRSQRYAQIQSTIAALGERYENNCSLLGVGMFRVEVTNLRRVSRSTGRLVPIYVEREYDDHTLPIRQLPTIDQPNADPDGPPSPANWMWGW